MNSSIHKNIKFNAAFNNLSGLFYCLHITIVFLLASISVVNSVTELANNEFDHLIFTQRWLPSSCLSINKNCKGSNCCKLPENYRVWSIHGLWPQNKDSFGPFFCNKSMHFNETLIESIKPALLELWPNIEKKNSASSLWKHEWLKHGSCAAVLDELNNEFKYFNKSLNLFEEVNMNRMFQAMELEPNNEGVNIMEVFDALKSILGKNPFLHCDNEIKEGVSYLAEIRLCYDLNLELIDCGVPPNGDLQKVPLSHSGVTNCPSDSPTQFPLSPFSPNLQNDALKMRYKRYLHYQHLNDLLKFVRFLLWVSL